MVASLFAVGFCLLLIQPLAAQAAVANPAWWLTVSSQPTNLSPGRTGLQGLLLTATNLGGADTDGPVELTAALPVGLEAGALEEGCEARGRRVRCLVERVLHPGETLVRLVPVSVDASTTGPIVSMATVAGGGAETARARTDTDVGAAPPSFGFVSGSAGLASVLSDASGGPATRAGSTPYEFLANLGFPTEPIGSELAVVGHPRDVSVDLPQGLALDPSVVPRCQTVQLESFSCPPGSQVGLIGVSIKIDTEFGFEQIPLYSVVPPPGSPSSLGFTLEGAVVLLNGSVRADDFGLSAGAADLLAKYGVAGLQLQLWGDPSDPSHDAVRGGSVAPSNRPLMTLPSACGPLAFGALTDSWENPGAFVSRSLPIEGPAGDALAVEGCSALAFEPTLTAQPTTSAADSPSGLGLNVVVPQRIDIGGSKSSGLHVASVSLPPGLVVNPSAAGGVASCTPTQIGLVTQVGRPDARFDAAPVACPDASKLGTLEVTTPLLQDAPAGSIYLAQPRQNPFGSLFALYAVVEEPRAGILIKLAGRVATDPATGQVTATFDQVPQLPFEEFKLDFFAGPGASLRTPPVCGSYDSDARLAPWSGTAAVSIASSFSIATSPAGTCANAPGRLPNAPRFDAGTTSTVAGRYSSFVLDLSRGDGSQELGGLEANLPEGLIGRAAGSATCSDAALAAAAARSGSDEKASPACPEGSRIGRALVDLGAGPNPYEVEGQIYLAGPYEGAPLSLAVVTPALAGPFDLGTVVVRAAVLVDPMTGRLTVRSDPLPRILDGVPLDIRSVRLEIDKAGFVRNPTSCEPMAITGSATSTLGQAAPLSARFQVGECAALAFKPKLSLRFSGAVRRGGHPTLRAALRADPEGAALKSASFALPSGQLLDLKHLRVLCPREAPPARCPGSSRLGSVRLYSPALEAPLEGPVYALVPRHGLPGIAAEVRSGAFRFLLRGRATAANGRLGMTLEALPDIPLSRAILSLAGGRRGILVNSVSLCRRVGPATAAFSAHDGARRRLRVRTHARGCGHG
jgi:hypothetical protein